MASASLEVLLSLLRRSSHGYGIISDVRRRTNGDVVIGTSSLYAIIRRLLRDGLIEDAGDMPAQETKGPPRRYYCITDAGRGQVHEEARRLRRAMESVEAVLGNPVSEAPGAEER